MTALDFPDSFKQEIVRRLSFRQLWDLCKQVGIKPRRKTSDMRADLLEPFAFEIEFRYASGIVALHFSPGFFTCEADRIARRTANRIARRMANKLSKSSPWLKLLETSKFPTEIRK